MAASVLNTLEGQAIEWAASLAIGAAGILSQSQSETDASFLADDLRDAMKKLQKAIEQIRFVADILR